MFRYYTLKNKELIYAEISGSLIKGKFTPKEIEAQLPPFLVLTYTYF